MASIRIKDLPDSERPPLARIAEGFVEDSARRQSCPNFHGMTGLKLFALNAKALPVGESAHIISLAS